jgi:hypothetical protein
MIRHVLAAGTLAGALLMVSAAPRPAEALPISKLQSNTESDVTLVRKSGGGHGGFRGHGGGGFKAGRSGGFRGLRGGHAKRFGGGHGGFGKPHFRGRGHHRGPKIRFRSRSYGYAPYYYGYYDSYYDDSCAWLRRKALRTGSRYWWRRYERCRHDYY